MIDYEEVVEAIWRYDIPRIDIDEDVTTLYADGKPFAQVIHRADGSREDLYFEDYELQKDTLIKPNATLRDVVELCMNGDISYADAREWCMENDISLGQFDRWLYGALRKSDTPARVKPKEPWPYRVVAGINRVLEILLNSILEDFIIPGHRLSCPMELLFKAKWTTGLTTKAISCKSRLTVPHIWFMQRMLL